MKKCIPLIVAIVVVIIIVIAVVVESVETWNDGLVFYEPPIQLLKSWITFL